MENILINTIKNQSKENPNNIALIWRNNIITYQELISRVEETSKKLSSLGIKPFDRIGVLLENTPEDLIIALAILNSYAVLIPIPYNYTKDEIEKHLKICATNILLDKKTLKLKTFNFKINQKQLPSILTNKDYTNIYNLPAIIRPTSGTTGKQKGVILTYQSIISRINYANQFLNINQNDNIFWCLSIAFHLAVSIMLFLQSGATINFQELNKLTISNNKIDKPISAIYATPWHYQLLINHDNLDDCIFKSLRFALSTGISLPTKIANNFYRRFNHPLRQAYGIIEAGLVAINYKNPPDDIASVGRICPGFEVKIKDIYNNKLLGEGELGEIYIKSKALFAGYVNTPANHLKDGWFATGDIGIIKDNVLYLKGRTKSVINTGGLKFFPEEVEHIIEEHNSIRQAWIYTKYDPRFGQIIKAKITTKDKNIDLYHLKQELKQSLNTKLSSYKIPIDFEFVESIPLTKTGKKLRCPLPFPAEIIVPHRPPMLLIDKLLERDREKETALLQAIVPSNGPFVYQKQLLDEYFIELCAQAMAVVNGYDAWLDNERPKEGFLVGIEQFKFKTSFQLEEDNILYIQVNKKFQFANITIMNCKIYYNQQEIIIGDLKVWSKTE